MSKLPSLCLLSMTALLLAGCVAPTITNLTPSRLPRKENGQYAFSVEYATRQSTILPDTFRAYVIVDNERIPMERTPLLSNRWETLVPVSQEVLNYRYRFEYQYKAIPVPKTAVRDSNPYQLTILSR